jgi:single-strand DNA-binding protein
MNRVILTGRLTADPEVRYTTGEKSTAIATFTLAVNRRFVKRDDPNAQTADFIRCQAFGKTAEMISNYFHKGQKADLEGRLQTGKYTNKDNQTVYTTDVIIDNIEFGESKKAASGNVDTPMAKPSVDINIPDGVDEELPFN